GNPQKVCRHELGTRARHHATAATDGNVSGGRGRVRDRELGDGVGEPPQQRGGVDDTAKNERKLLATIASEKIGWSGHRLQCRRDLAKRRISRKVPVAVVESLEMVGIDHADTNGFSRLGGAGAKSRKFQIEMAAISY